MPAGLLWTQDGTSAGGALALGDADADADADARAYVGRDVTLTGHARLSALVAHLAKQRSHFTHSQDRLLQALLARDPNQLLPPAVDDDTLRQGGVDWYRRALSLRGPVEAEAAGVTQWDPQRSPPGLTPCDGLLMGGAGVGLALLAATTDRAPRWDRFLMMS